MAGSVNKVTLVGNLGKDPEIKSLQSGMRVANFSVATSENWTDKTSGERQEKTEWHRIVVINDALVTVVEKYLKKGSKVYLEGKLQTRKWTDQSGAEKYSTEIVIGRFGAELVLLDRPAGGSSEGGERSYRESAPQSRSGQQTRAPAMAGGGGGQSWEDLGDEGIPF